MEVCPKCGKPVEANDHMTTVGSRSISQINCECGYHRIHIKLGKDDSERE